MSNDPIYAIIGRGYAAAVNYETLRLTENPRLCDGLNVFFFGKPDPWLGFADHPMGQCKTLMSVPGFKDQSKGENYYSSQDFAARTRRQFESILSRNGVDAKHRILEHCVQGPRGNFELTLIDPVTSDRRTVTAKYVDVCTGLGSPRVLWGPHGVRLSDARLLVQATTFMTEDYDEETVKNEIVGIYGGGAVGAVCCELAFKRGARRVIWASNDEFEGAFLPSGRFDKLGQRTAARIHGLDSRIRLFTNADLYPEPMPAGDLQVSISQMTGRAASRIEGSDEKPYTRQHEHCSLLILAAGFEPNRVDKPLTGIVGRGWRAILGQTPGLTNTPVGLQDWTGRIRVLGAAALNHLDFDRYAKGNRVLGDWIASLSRQLMAPGGPPVAVAVAARLIAEANGYFPYFAGTGSGPNWNCAFRANIEQCLSSAVLDTVGDQVDEWLRKRSTADVLQRVPSFARDTNGNPLGDVVYAPPAGKGAAN
ncbi:MAG TPA: hypothetical protein VGL82_09235 [Bryobacteraceae bacterium]|jgi:hypothetical protein